MASATDGSLAQDAATFIGQYSDPIRGVDGDSTEIDRQAFLLVQWAGWRNAKLGNSHFEGLRRLGNATAEHEVFHRVHDNRAIKRTHNGCFGVTPETKGKQKAATPLFYLKRLLLMNQEFNSLLRMEGVAFGKCLVLGKTSGEHPCIVTSQPWYEAANPAKPHPSAVEIKQFMGQFGFQEDASAYYAWTNKRKRISIIDAREDNFIKTEYGVIPIDLVIRQDLPSGIEDWRIFTP